MKTEIWNGHQIRFVQVKEEWWAVLSDVANAMELKPKYVKERLDDEVVSTDHVPDKLGRMQEMLIVNEFGIYDTIFSSKKKEAKQFKRWVFNVIKTLRTQSGLEGFEIFKTLDKEHQRKMMNQLNQSLSHPVQLNFIKANIVANKAVSNKFGFKKMVKKSNMTPQMLAEREHILEDVVSLMALQDKYGLNISVSKTIYNSEKLNEPQSV
jgi:prophage antirepressor-like protein